MNKLMTMTKPNIRAILLSIIFIYLTSLLPMSSHAGSWNGWIYQSPYPTSNTLLGVKFITPMKGWAVGVSGTILHTQDGGQNWEFQDSGTEQDLRAVAFVNDKAGWAAGNGGTIIHTEDGGKTWKRQGSVKDSLHQAFFLNEKEGWIGGDNGTLLSTKDGGKNWEKKDVGAVWPVAGIYFVSSDTGWILGGERVHRTTDGGNTWKTTRLPMPQRRETRSYYEDEYGWSGGIDFINDQKGWAVLNFEYIYHTEDGGKTWQVSDLGFPSYGVSNVDFADEKHGCVGGTSILCTEDGGKTWKERLGIKPGGSEWGGGFLISIQAISLANQKEGWAVGGSGNVGGDDGHILKTEDGGKSWKVISRSTWPAYFIESKVGWTVQNESRLEKGRIVKRGRVVRTDDGGVTWTVQKEFDAYVYINFFFIDSTTGWAVGQKKTRDTSGTKNLNYFILHTADGGKTWIMQFDEPANPKDTIFDGLSDVFFIDPTYGWVVGSRGRILHTMDGGKHWEHQKSGTKFRLRRVQFLDEKIGWVIGENATEKGSTAIILHTDNGGKDWQIQWKKKVDWAWSFGLQFADSHIGWVSVGIHEYSGDYLLVHTTDGGKTWTETEYIEIYPDQMIFLDKNRGVILTEKRHILITRDGGKTWARKIKPLHRYPWHVSEVFK